MKLLYAHDHKFYKYKNDYYSSGSFPREVISRYTNVFEDVIFISRQIQVNNKPNKMSLATNERVKFIEIPNFKSFKTFYKKRNANKKIKNEVKAADCIIARLPSTIGSIAIKYAIEYDRPYLVEVVGCAWDSLWNHGNVVGKVLAPFSFLRTRKLISKSKYVIYITEDFLQLRYPSYGKTCICPNVNIDKVEKKVLDHRLKTIDNKKEQDILVFGLVGSLDVSYKGHETVIKACSLIKNKIPNFRIEFLGEGNPDRWIKLAKEHGIYENIKCLGTLPSGDAVFKWMDNLDVYLQPSSAEAQGRAIIEAMSRGCPVIASRVGGIPELIDHDWLINSCNYVELSNKITELVADSELIKQQAIRNFEQAKQYYKDKIEFRRNIFLRQFREQVEKTY